MNIQVSALMEFFSHLQRFMQVAAFLRPEPIGEKGAELVVGFCQHPIDYLVGCELHYKVEDKPLRHVRLYVDPQGQLELAAFAHTSKGIHKDFELEGYFLDEQLVHNPAAAANEMGLDMLEWLFHSRLVCASQVARQNYAYRQLNTSPPQD